MKHSPSRRFRLAARPVPVALLALAAACADDSTPTTPLTPADSEVLSVLSCNVQLPAGELTCVDAADPGNPALSRAARPDGGPLLDQQTIGGQGSYVRLSSSGNNYAAGTFSMNVTVQNLSNLAMGTDDGATRHASGLQVFFASGPTPSGAGTVAVANATGTGTFTAADQPFFQYGGTIGGVDQTDLGADGILSSSEVSSAKSWQFTVDAVTTSFNFLVYVRTNMPSGTPATVAPQVSSVSEPTLVPGDTVTLTGMNFNATSASNTVRIGGVTATVLNGGTTTSLNVIVPCVGSGSKAVQVTQGGMSGVPVARTVQVAQRTVAVGEALIVTNPAEVGCNEITPSGGTARYVLSVYSASTSPTSSAPFILTGDPEANPESIVQGNASTSLMLPSGLAASRMQQGGTDDVKHAQLMERNREQYEVLRARFAGDPRMRPRRNVVAADPVEPPLTRTFRVSDINSSNICNNFYVVSATRVYYDGKIAIYEDDATPVAFKAANSATMASNYQRIGDQFNADMEPIVRNNFGDILRRDQITDNNGVLVALFTPRINNSFSGVAGFVISCDQYPNADANPEPAVGGPYAGSSVGSNAASNFGEFFYAYQPVTNAAGYSGNTPDNWYRTIRSTFIHESKHVASMAARTANNTGNLEAAWLEEGTARHVEELWGRNAVDNIAWKSNYGYGSMADPKNLYCDFRPEGWSECDANTRRPAAIMQRHFTTLYTHLFGTNARLLSPFGPTASDNAAYYYAVSWSFVRYIIDRYGVSDAAFLTALTQASTNGAASLEAISGQPIDRLLGGWNLALAVDDWPGLASPSLDSQMQTWNMRSIYAGMNTDFPGTYTLAYPQVPASFSFGAFTAPTITTLRGGGSVWYQISGTHTQPQLIRLSGNGGALPSTVRLAITRVE